MLTTGKGTHYCVYCGFDMKATEDRDCPACDGDLCQAKKRVAKATTPKKNANPLYDGATTCRCVERVNGALADSNSTLVTTLFTNKVALRTEKLESAKRGRIPVMLASFCPFCGAAYPESTEKAEKKR